MVLALDTTNIRMEATMPFAMLIFIRQIIVFFGHSYEKYSTLLYKYFKIAKQNLELQYKKQ